MSAPGDHSSSRSADLTISFTFAVGGALAGVAGILWMIFPGSMRFDTGFQTGLIAFTAAVLGGIGNLKGAVAGSRSGPTSTRRSGRPSTSPSTRS